MTFILLDKVQENRSKELAGTTQVANLSARPVTVTDEGHVLLPGQVAAISADDQTLAKMLNKGLVGGVGYSAPSSGGSAAPRKSPSTSPKGQASSEGTAARGKKKQ